MIPLSYHIDDLDEITDIKTIDQEAMVEESEEVDPLTAVKFQWDHREFKYKGVKYITGLQLNFNEKLVFLKLYIGLATHERWLVRRLFPSRLK